MVLGLFGTLLGNLIIAMALLIWLPEYTLSHMLKKGIISIDRVKIWHLDFVLRGYMILILYLYIMWNYELLVHFDSIKPQTDTLFGVNHGLVCTLIFSLYVAGMIFFGDEPLDIIENANKKACSVTQ